MDSYRIAIVGSGTIAIATAILFSDLPNTAVTLFSDQVHSRNAKLQPQKSFAISKGTISVLSKLGIWRLIKEHAFGYNKMRVSGLSQTGQRHFLDIDAQELSETYLGFIIREEHLLGGLRNRLNDLSITQQHVQYKKEHYGDSYKLFSSYDLCIIADGRADELIRFVSPNPSTKNYEQHAVVCDIQTDTKIDLKALQSFTSYGPLALLPTSDYSYSLIWSLENSHASEIIHWKDEVLLTYVSEAFGAEVPQRMEVSCRHMFPLSYYHASHYYRESFVLLGDAAHRLHPLAGQGLNLGFSDISSLYINLNKGINNRWKLDFFLLLNGYHRERRKENLKLLFMI